MSKRLLLVVAMLMCPVGARGQDSVIAELYGVGVHAFFSNDHKQAHEYLTMAIDQGATDPRCYYFRGLAYDRLGRPDEAKADFKKGAELEIANLDRFYPVSQALQRVQGGARLELEKQRQQARIAARLRNEQVKRTRYEQLQRAESQVLRTPRRQAPPGAQELVGPAKASGNDPFSGATASEPEAAPATAARTPAATGDATAASADPFGGGGGAMPAADPGAAADPFGGGAMPAADPGAAADPFGGGAAPAADPFGGGAAPAADPFGGAGNNDAATNPFADDPPANKPN